MAYTLAEFQECHVPAAQAFNQRMLAAGGHTEAGFLLPEHPNSGSRIQHYVVLEQDAIRGGCLIETRRHWLAGAETEVWNIQSPLSEGLIDRAHSNVAVYMMRTLLKRQPLLYGVGMGSELRPFPRLLKALGWRVTQVPFFFRVLRGNRFLREVRVLREPRWRNVAANLAAATGAGAVAFGLLHWRPPVRGAIPKPVSNFSARTDALWVQERERWAFAAVRDSAALNDVYGPTFSGQRLELEDGSAWAATTLADFDRHHHFGTLRVATIADLIAPLAHLPAFVERLVERLRTEGADLVVSNQADPAYQSALRQRGFLPGPSNFLLGASRGLVDRIDGGPIHLNRGDGDGLINLA